jgi:hypothetical protein
MGVIAVFSKILLLHLSVSLALILGNEIEKKEISSNYDRNNSTDSMTGKHSHGERANYHKFEGKRNFRNNYTKKFHNEQTENKTEIMELASNKLKKGLLVVPGLGRGDRLKVVHSNIKLLVSSGILLHKTKKEEIERNFMNSTNNSEQNKEYNNIWDCVVHVYIQKPNGTDIPNHEFWSKTAEINYLENFCEIVLNPGKLLSHNLHLVQPEIVESSYEYVFILLDDCRLIPTQMSNFSTNSTSNDNNNVIDNNNNNRKERETDHNEETFDLHKILRIMKSNDLTLASPMVRHTLNCYVMLCYVVIYYIV